MGVSYSMDTASSILSSVPDTVWAAIIASGLTLAGVYLTNRHYAKLQRQQLEHEKLEGLGSRQFEMRQRVYLDASAAMGEAYRYLVNLTDVDHTDSDNDVPSRKLHSALSAAALVASQDTAEAIGEFAREFARAQLDFLIMADPAQDARLDRNHHDQQYRWYEKESDRLAIAMEKYMEEGRNDPSAFDAMRVMSDARIKSMRLEADARTKAWDDFGRAKVDFLRKAIPRLRELSQVGVPASVLMRRELGIESNLDRYRAQQERAFKEVLEGLERLLAHLEQKLDV